MVCWGLPDDGFYSVTPDPRGGLVGRGRFQGGNVHVDLDKPFGCRRSGNVGGRVALPHGAFAPSGRRALRSLGLRPAAHRTLQQPQGNGNSSATIGLPWPSVLSLPLSLSTPVALRPECPRVSRRGRPHMSSKLPRPLPSSILTRQLQATTDHKTSRHELASWMAPLTGISGFAFPLQVAGKHPGVFSTGSATRPLSHSPRRMICFTLFSHRAMSTVYWSKAGELRRNLRSGGS
jgi:hypothetical protein